MPHKKPPKEDSPKPTNWLGVRLQSWEGGAFSGNCSDILRWGVFDEIYIDTSRSLSESLYEWLRSVDYGTLKQKVDSGLQIGFPIEGVPLSIKGSVSVDEYEQWRRDVDEGRTRHFTENETMTMWKKSVNKDIVDAWLKCNEPKAGLQATSNVQEPFITITYSYSPIKLDDAYPIVTEFIVEGATCGKPLVPGTEIPYQGITVVLTRTGTGPVVVILNTDSGSLVNTFEALEVPDTKPVLPSLRVVRPAPIIVPVTDSPMGTASVSSEYKIVGGGAHVNWLLYSAYGNLLVASYPENLYRWIAKSKSHTVPSPASLEVYLMALYDPQDEWDVQIFSTLSEGDTAVATIPPGYVLTGGGGQALFYGYGRLLTASYPQDERSWVVKAKAHTSHDYGGTVAYAIGMRPRNGAPNLETFIFSARSGTSGSTESIVAVDPGWTMTGGGAYVDWTGYGNLLWASYPVSDREWKACSKDHDSPCPASIVSYAIGVKMPD